MQTIFTTFIGVSAVSSESSSSRKSTLVRDFSFSSLSNFQNVNLLNKSQIPRSKVIHVLQHLSTNQNRCILKRSRKCFYKACLLRYLCLRDFLFKKNFKVLIRVEALPIDKLDNQDLPLLLETHAPGLQKVGLRVLRLIRHPVMKVYSLGLQFHHHPPVLIYQNPHHSFQGHARLGLQPHQSLQYILEMEKGFSVPEEQLGLVPLSLLSRKVVRKWEVWASFNVLHVKKFH